tara:strand:+ start:125 stop:643 length:519 start_codon:yes stop_codon:yes gene_type:complete
MKKLLKIIFIIFFISISKVYSEIYFINLDKIVNQSEAGKLINKNISEKNKKNDLEFKKKRDELKKQEEELINQKNILSEEDFGKKLNTLKKNVNDFNLKNKERLENQRKNLVVYKTKLLKSIEPILIEYMKENNISYILQKKNILIGREDLDKTDEIINIVNQKVDKIIFND